MAVTCLAGLHHFELTEAGREMLFFKAMSIMQRAGISEKLGNALLVAIPRMIAQGRKATARGN